MVSEQLRQSDIHKSIGPDGNHPRVPRELAEVLTEPLSITYQLYWKSGKVSVEWKLANVMPIYKKGWREIPGNYRPVCLSDVGAREGYGADDPECHHTAYAGQPQDQP
ncbi:rna-directed dna polymerase from mobile element jockey-like [Pitangus sulphuratus]|nr:rna-directed dna polymerase from mobile element jockey-like [Pitangus sulphuratus]